MYGIYKIVGSLETEEKVYYVGMSDHPNKRFGEHILKNNKFDGLVKQFDEAGKMLKSEIIEWPPTEKQAQIKEKYWILRYQEEGQPLLNQVLAPEVEIAIKSPQRAIPKLLNSPLDKHPISINVESDIEKAILSILEQENIPMMWGALNKKLRKFPLDICRSVLNKLVQQGSVMKDQRWYYLPNSRRIGAS